MVSTAFFLSIFWKYLHVTGNQNTALFHWTIFRSTHTIFTPHVAKTRTKHETSKKGFMRKKRINVGVYCVRHLIGSASGKCVDSLHGIEWMASEKKGNSLLKRRIVKNYTVNRMYLCYNGTVGRTTCDIELFFLFIERFMWFLLSTLSALTNRIEFIAHLAFRLREYFTKGNPFVALFSYRRIPLRRIQWINFFRFYCYGEMKETHVIFEWSRVYTHAENSLLKSINLISNFDPLRCIVSALVI